MLKAMFRYLILLILVSTFYNAFSQKLYIWCPKDIIAAPRTSFLEEEKINLVLFDGRLMTPKSKIECTSEEVIGEFVSLVKATYPNAFINVLPPTEYYSDPADSVITIRIGISAYHAAFGADVSVGIGQVGGEFSWGLFPSSEWHGLVGIAVTITKNGQSTSRSIAKVNSKSNNAGFKTAKNMLTTSYMQAVQEMLFFIDETLH